jgi:hypothetical protein
MDEKAKWEDGRTKRGDERVRERVKREDGSGESVRTEE